MGEINKQQSEKDITEQNPQSGGNLVERNEKGQWVRGHKKLGGDRTGTKNKKKIFDEMFDEAVKEIVDNKELKIDNPEKKMMVKGIIEALKGNPHFWKILAEYRYGKPKETLDLTSGGEPLGVVFLPMRKKEQLKEDERLEAPKSPNNSPTE